MTHGREATNEDSSLLDAFSCADPSREWEQEVEDAVHDSLIWLTERRGRWVRLFDLDGVLSVVVAYEFDTPPNPEAGFYIPYLAVATGHQGNQLAGFALDAVVPFMSAESFGGPITAKIHVANENSQKFARKKGLVIVEAGSDDPNYQLWRVN